MSAEAILILVGVGLLIAAATGSIIYPDKVDVKPLARILSGVLGAILLGSGMFLIFSDDGRRADGGSVAGPTTMADTTTTSEPTTTADSSTTTEATTTTTSTVLDDERSCSFAPISTGEIAGSVAIKSLSDGQVGGQDLNGTLTGVQAGVSDDVDIWVANAPSDSEVLYVQSHNSDADPAIREGDEFSGFSFMTTDGPHEVIILLAERSASDFFRATLLEWVASGEYTGIPRNDMPDGVVEAACITVVFEAT